MQTFIETLKHPNQNGITIFVLGILFILGIYHFLLYFQHRDKVYLYYSLYVFLIFIGLLNRPTQGFVTYFVQPFKGFLDHISLNLILVYHLVYIIFASLVIDLKSYSQKWHRFFYWAVLIIIGYAVLLEMLYLISGNIQFVLKGHILFTLMSYTIGFLFYFPLFKTKSQLKYYIIVGSVFLVLSTLFVSIIKRTDLSIEDQDIRYSIFYAGIVLENIFFSLALGHKQKIILKERNESSVMSFVNWRYILYFC